MTLQTQTARLLDIRDGFDLVDFAEVGLPIFRLTVEAATLARQEMPTTNEFVIRAISIGETQPSDIADLLGLSEHDVIEAISLLCYDRCVETAPSSVEPVADSPSESYQLTDLGREFLADGLHAPRDEMLVFDFDGLRRRPIKLGNESLLRPKELADRGAIQLRPYPAEPPDVLQLNLSEVARAVRRLSTKEFGRAVLAIRRIVRRDNLFRPALGLLFRNRFTTELQLGFAFGEQLAEDYEIEFARHGGTKKPGLIRLSAEADGRAGLRAVLSDHMFRRIAEAEEASKRRLEVTLASRDRAALGARLERLRRRSKTRADEQDELPAVEERLTRARTKLRDLELRSLAPYEQWELLNEALDTAETRLLITSDDIDPEIVTAFMLRKLDERLRADVEVRIETSIAVNAIPRRGPGSFEPGVELWLLCEQRARLSLVQPPNSRQDLFLLIKDQDLAVISNKPFLNARRQPLNFIPTVGVVSHHRSTVARVAEIVGFDRA
jgi:hypothetical protein